MTIYPNLCLQPRLWPRCTLASKRSFNEKSSDTRKKSGFWSGRYIIFSVQRRMIQITINHTQHRRFHMVWRNTRSPEISSTWGWGGLTTAAALDWYPRQAYPTVRARGGRSHKKPKKKKKTRKKHVDLKSVLVYIKLLNSDTDMRVVSSLALARGHVAHMPITNHVTGHNIKHNKPE